MTPQARKAGIAALVGTVMEWYDFIIYGTAAAIVLNKVFFPAVDPLVGTLAVFATYAVGFARVHWVAFFSAIWGTVRVAGRCSS